MQMRTRSRTAPLLISLGAAAALALALLALGPVPRTLSHQVSGDGALVDEVLATVEDGPRSALAAALIDSDGTVRTGARGADAHTPFETASLTKTFTAALFADAVDRGEVRPESTLGQLVPGVTGDAAEVTLEQLATHTSGLPRLGFTGVVDMARTFAAPYWAGNPYAGTSEDDLVTMLSRADVSPEQGFEYSNLGFSALGLAVAHAAGTSYADLLRERILTPLGMEETTLLETQDDVPANAITGYTATGDRSAYWWSGAYSPSGALMSTVHDLTLFTQALLDGSAPGADALQTRTTLPSGAEVGYAWHVLPGSGGTQDITWHNGMNGGFSSLLAMGADGSAVVVLSSTAVDVTSARSLLDEGGRR